MRLLALVRGINVGGHHAVPMTELRAAFAEFGCTDVATYIQSGNVVCTAPHKLVSGEIASALQTRFGFAVPVVLRSLRELAAVIAANPFAAATDSRGIHAVFFEQAPASTIVRTLEGKCAGEEQLAAHGRELFLHLPQGTGRSKLALACVAPNVPGNPTMRNWKTVLQLHSMLQG